MMVSLKGVRDWEVRRAGRTRHISGASLIQGDSSRKVLPTAAEVSRIYKRESVRRQLECERVTAYALTVESASRLRGREARKTIRICMASHIHEARRVDHYSRRVT